MTTIRAVVSHGTPRADGTPRSRCPLQRIDAADYRPRDECTHDLAPRVYPAGTTVHGNCVIGDVDQDGNPIVDDQMFEDILNDRDLASNPGANPRDAIAAIRRLETLTVIGNDGSRTVPGERAALTFWIPTRAQAHRTICGTRTARKTTARRAQAHSASSPSSSSDDSGGGEPPGPNSPAARAAEGRAKAVVR